jgi:ABC-2 type transport system ATP-binding protein
MEQKSVTLAVETNKLTRRFGAVCAVDGLDLRVEEGKFFGFLGPNGAGKSTTIKMLTGLLAPSSGAMRILGVDLAVADAAREVKRRIGVVPEDLALFDNLTAEEYLTFIGRMYLLPATTVKQRCRELLAMMNLDHDEKKITLEYSHGMKKKLALAAALLPDPDLLFLDEPFEGVDAVASRILRDTLKQFVKRGATVFLTSHVLEIVEKLCTDVGIIAQGRLVFQGQMSDINQTGTLEERFLAIAGDGQPERQKLSWLEE